MPEFRVTVFYTTRASIVVHAEDADEAEERVSEMDWRDNDFVVADGSAEIESVEEV